MKKYTLIFVALLGFSFATMAQTRAEKRQAKKEMRLSLKAEKKALRAKTELSTDEKAAASKEKVEEVKVVEEKFVGNPETPITFQNLTIERNDIEKGTDDMFSFTFMNTGVTPILVERVQTSCGCTTANKPDEAVQPGETAEISVKYDTNREGAFTKTITVYTNVGEPVVLTIKGNVLTPAVQEEQKKEVEMH